MHVLLLISIWACILLVASSLVIMSVFAARAVLIGKVSSISALMLVAPLGLGALLALVLGEVVRGAIIACAAVLVLTLLAVIASGIRGFWAG
ncbi:MAG TPA: hypothetical protein VFG50_02685 [Rhodothermales bacterium]|nr:hypothetical protein [Rhodothermales bacterium]